MARTPNRSPQTHQVLAALLQQPTVWRYGYDLSKQTELQSGTLYPILMRLTEQGLLEDTWEPSDQAGRPLRHAYRLTAPGIAAAREILQGERAALRLRLSKAPSR